MDHKSEKVMQTVFFLTACISIVSILLICISLFSNGLPAIKEIGIIKFLFGKVWRPSNDEFGILPIIVGSLYATLGALVTSVPIGISTAVSMACSCPNKLYKPLKAGTNLMAGIPSVAYGFFGLVVLVPFAHDYISGYSMGVLTATILPGIMILPTIVGVSETTIHAVPHRYYEGGLALRASHERSIFFVALPTAERGLLTAIILGLGRAAGKTMAVIMVVGDRAILPKVLTSGMRALTTNIVVEMGYSTGLHREILIGIVIVLFIFVLVINICFSLLHREE